MAIEEMRSPICSVMGHVDHGKSSLLDYIRKTNIVAREAGAITQAIGASIVPIETLREICGKCLKDLKREYFTVPGLLFIDTPGHAAFTNLRKRGGNLADIAILVININEGCKPQTIEAIKILKQYKTPFVIAANKVDLMQGFRSNPTQPIIQNVSQRDQRLITEFETKVYEIVGKLHDEGFESERFDRIQDYTKQIAIVPISALTGDGIPELLMIVAGLAQKFLEKALHFDINAPGKGTILEVKEEQGMGTSMDVIVYDGNIKTGDTIVVGTLGEPIVTKVRCLFEPAPHNEMMDKKTKYQAVKQVFAATGVKISGPDLDGAMAGMPILVANDNVEAAKESIVHDIDEVIFEGDEQGIVVKADSLGSLEALVRTLREAGFSIKKASVGEISKKDLADAEACLDGDPLDGAIIGFNLKPVEDEDIKVITSNVIYTLIDDFEAWRKLKHNQMELKKLDGLTKPAKFEYLQNHTFRQNNPAVIGVEVLAGKLSPGIDIMNRDGLVLGKMKQVQKDNKSVNNVKKGEQVAVSIEGVTTGRQIEEGDILYAALTENEFRKLKEAKEFLEGEDKALLKEIADIMRKQNPVWGV